MGATATELRDVLIIGAPLERPGLLHRLLATAGFNVHEATSVTQAIFDIHARAPGLAILDAGAIEGGINAGIAELRRESRIPIVVISARASERDKIDALDAGADDYLVKPYLAGELLARIRAHLRRRQRGSESDPTLREFGTLRMDLVNRRVERDGALLRLTPTQFRLLAHLAEFPNCIRTHHQLLDAIWGCRDARSAANLRVQMMMLRKQLEDDPARPRRLVTESGVGYRFVP